MVHSRRFLARMGLALVGGCSLVLLGLLLAGTFNARSPEGEVTGTVRIKGGEFLPAGEVTFVDEKGNSKTRAIGPGGAYRVPGLPLGPMKIVVRSMQPGAAVISAFGKDGNKSPPTKPKLKIHKRYEDASTSNLEYTVRKGEQTYNIELDP
jgi:hypothetical protein